MRQLQRLTMAAVLVLAVTMSVFGGDIPIGKEPPPPPPNSVTAPGDIPIGIVKEDANSTNSLLEEIVLNLVQTVLSVY